MKALCALVCLSLGATSLRADTPEDEKARAVVAVELAKLALPKLAQPVSAEPDVPYCWRDAYGNLHFTATPPASPVFGVEGYDTYGACSGGTCTTASPAQTRRGLFGRWR